VEHEIERDTEKYTHKNRAIGKYEKINRISYENDSQIYQWLDHHALIGEGIDEKK
jgi:hypothetical protein